MFRTLFSICFLCSLFSVQASSLKVLRKAPLAYSVGSSMVSSMREGVYQMLFQLGQTVDYLSELPKSRWGRALALLPTVVLNGRAVIAAHEVAGHGELQILMGLPKPEYSWGQKGQLRSRGAFLSRTFLGLGAGGATSYTRIKDANWDAYRDVLVEHDYCRNNVEVQAAFQKILDNPVSFLKFRLSMQRSYAGLNASVEFGRYMWMQTLMGESVRPETLFGLLISKLDPATYITDDETLSNDMNSIDIYLNSLGMSDGTQTFRMLSALSVLSGSVISAVRGMINNTMVGPLWIKDTVLWPELSAYQTLWGPSLLVESGVKLSRRFFLTGGVEIVCAKADNPVANKTESDFLRDDVSYSKYGMLKPKRQEFRVGLGFTSDQLHVLGYTLIGGKGGSVRFVYTPEKTFSHLGVRLGVEGGISWASYNTLSGEREAQARIYASEKLVDQDFVGCNAYLDNAPHVAVWLGARIVF